MEIQIHTDPNFNLTLCSFFAGVLLMSHDNELCKKAGSNYRRLYALLSVNEKKELKAEVKRFIDNPGAAISQQADLLNEIANDDDFLDTIKTPE